MRGCTQWKPARVLDGKLYMVVLVNFLSDRCYSKKALLNADAVLLLIPKHPVSAIKLIIGTPKQVKNVIDIKIPWLISFSKT